MKSRTLSCNARILRKDLTRYFPVWGCYCVILLLIAYGLRLAEVDYYDNYDLVTGVSQFLNPTYGLICALCLFGYLCKSRECNMIHALPVRREQLFAIHLLAAVLMSLLPNLLFLLANYGLCGGGFLAYLSRFEMEFLYSFALAVFCMMLAGNRLGAFTVQYLINGTPALITMTMCVLYLPMLPSVVIDESGFLARSVLDMLTPEGLTLTGNMITARYALAALVLLGACLVLYRRRKLEYAGNFLAVKLLEPVFAVAVSIFAGCVFAAYGLMLTSEAQYILLGIGALLGYFGSMMLLKRTVKVFKPLYLAGGAAVTAVILGSVFLVSSLSHWIITWVPDPQKVASVEIGEYYSSYDEGRYSSDDPEVIEDVTRLQKLILEKDLEIQSSRYEFRYDGNSYDGLAIVYHMANGSEIIREYDLADPQVLAQADYYYSQPELLLNVHTMTDLVNGLHTLQVMTPDGTELGYINGSRRVTFLQTLFREAEEGKLYRSSDEGRVYQILINGYRTVWVTEDAADTLALLEKYFP